MIHFTKKEENSSNIENKAMETSYGWYFITDEFILTLKNQHFEVKVTGDLRHVFSSDVTVAHLCQLRISFFIV